MIKAHLSKLLLTIIVLSPLLSAITPAAYAAPVLDGIGAVMNGPNIQKGHSERKLTELYATYKDGVDMTQENILGQTAFTSSNPLVATIDSATGFVTAYDVGTTVLQTVYGGLNYSFQINVQDLVISPSSAEIEKGQSQTFTATFFDSDGTSRDVTSDVVWGITDLSIASVSGNGIIQGNNKGTTNVTASYGSTSNITALNVVGLTDILVQPNDFEIPFEENTHFTATALYSNGTSKDVTTEADWSVNDPTKATVVSKGLIKGIEPGFLIVTATYNGLPGNTQGNVKTPPVLTSITVEPSNTSIEIGKTQQYKATATFDDGSTKDVTDTAAWSSSNGAIAVTDAKGLATAVSNGVTSINASYGGKNGQADLQATKPSVVSVKISPVNPTIHVGEQQAFVATATYSDGSTFDVTNAATSSWMAVNPLIAKQTSTKGTFQGSMVGSSIIGVFYQGYCDSTNLTIIYAPTPPTTEPRVTPPPTEPPVTPPLVVTQPPVVVDPEPVKILGRVFGVVKDVTGKPLKRVRVEIHSDPQITFTDDSGVYSFDNLPLGEHEISLMDDDLKEIGRISVVVGDIQQNNSKETRLMLSKDKPEGQVSFYIEPLTKEVVTEEPKPEPQPEKIPVIEEPKQEDNVDVAKIDQKPNQSKITKSELPKQPSVEIISKPIVAPEPTVTPEPKVTPEPTVSKKPGPTKVTTPQVNPEHKSIIRYVPLVQGGLAAAAGFLIVITLIRRKRITVVVKRQGEILGSVKVPVHAVTKVSISDIVKTTGWIKVEVLEKDTAKLSGKKLEIYHRGQQFEPIISYKVSETNLKRKISEEYPIK